MSDQPINPTQTNDETEPIKPEIRPETHVEPVTEPKKKPVSRARGLTVQVKPCKRVRSSSCNTVSTKGSLDQALFKRLCNILSKRWEAITRPEVSLICGVVYYLQIQGKRTGNKEEMMRFLGFRMKPAMNKQYRWLEKLADKGFLLRVQWDSGEVSRRGHGYGLTEYGQSFIQDLDREYDKARQWVEDQNRYTDIVIYLDRVKEQLHPRQRALFTPKQIEQLRAIGKEP